MSTTLLTLRGNVRNHIDEPTANYWTNAELNSLISSSQLDLWRKIYALKKDYFLSPTPYTLNLVAGTYQYTLATDFFRATAIRTITSGYQDMEWVPADPSSPVFIEGLRTDVPIYYPNQILYSIRNNNTIWVSPLPTQSLSAYVDYIQLPTAVSSDSDTFLPMLDPFLDYIEYDATATALAKGPVGNVQYWNNLADGAWKDVALALDTPRNDQGPDVVRGYMEGW